ncbi:BrnA antitoxin family protein [Pseudoroseomonas ludipueritiae]|uniref:BrnA antitoxin family protein n=1 Tax=Pseudoroseomonas ludipueritiae TaxID=198093 RepID=A0ABR7R7L2_9PROT|nr:BrnA antitoxin family protein [Pseudoroseomonas ludipueritiae]MBC9177746.1 BrnA antitoxin family protein [Pseudoroseomonas ludipueritiae]
MPRKLRRNTGAEEAAIQRGIAQDPDNPEWTEEMFARARPAAEVLGPQMVKAFQRARVLPEKRMRGPQKAPTKVAINLRLDADLVAALRATGPGWQGRVNAMLRKAVLG